MDHLAAILALALLAPPSRAPLEGCDAIPSIAWGSEEGWQYGCGDLQAWVEDHPVTGERAAKLLELRMDTVRSNVPDGAKTRSERRTLGGADVEVLVTAVDGAPGAALVAAIPYPKGTRILTCAGGRARCGTVLAALAASTWQGPAAAGAVRKEPPPLAIGGRALQPPPGCEAKRQPPGAAIRCGKADWVMWMEGDERAARTMAAKQAPLYREKFGKGWRTEEAEGPCLVAGVKTTCSRIVAQSGLLDAATVVWAVAPVGDRYAFASCFSRGKRPKAPCSLVIELGELP